LVYSFGAWLWSATAQRVCRRRLTAYLAHALWRFGCAKYFAQESGSVRTMMNQRQSEPLLPLHQMFWRDGSEVAIGTDWLTALPVRDADDPSNDLSASGSPRRAQCRQLTNDGSPGNTEDEDLAHEQQAARKLVLRDPVLRRCPI